MISRLRDLEPAEALPGRPNVWLLQHGPCWCRGNPGESGSFDLIRFRSNRIDLGDVGLHFLVVSERVLEGSGPSCRQVYDSIPEPKVVIASGVCPGATRFWTEPLVASTPVSDLLPVDVTIPDCIFGRPEALLEPVFALCRSQPADRRIHLSGAGIG